MAKPSVQIKVEGMRELRRQLNKYGGPEIRKELNAAIKEGANKHIVPAAQRKAPKRSGKMARSIRPRVNAKGVSIAIRPIYSPVIHWGWPDRNIKEQPFLADAIAEHATAFAAEYERIMKAFAARVTAKLNTQNRLFKR